MTPVSELLNRAARHLEVRGGMNAYTALLKVSQGGESIREAMLALLLHLGIPFKVDGRFRSPVERWCYEDGRSQAEVIAVLRATAEEIDHA